MKKTFLKVIGISAGLMLVAVPALAATTASLAPSTVNVTQGQNFNLAVSVNPAGAKNYTIKIKLNYPADLLEVQSFTFGSNWMPLIQADYDLIDNTNGVLIKTGGYPGGLSANAAFGTISFSAKKSGSGTIKFDSASLALDATNQNVFSGGNQVSVTIAQATASQSAKPTTSTSPEPSISVSVSPSISASPTPSETVAASPSPSATTENQAANLFAGIGNILSLGSGSAIVAIIVILLVIIGIVYLVIYLVNRSKRSKIE